MIYDHIYVCFCKQWNCSDSEQLHWNDHVSVMNCISFHYFMLSLSLIHFVPFTMKCLQRSFAAVMSSWGSCTNVALKVVSWRDSRIMSGKILHILNNILIWTQTLMVNILMILPSLLTRVKGHTRPTASWNVPTAYTAYLIRARLLFGRGEIQKIFGDLALNLTWNPEDLLLLGALRIALRWNDSVKSVENIEVL